MTKLHPVTSQHTLYCEVIDHMRTTAHETASMGTTTIYSPLNLEHREIRLMRITSRAASSAIHCELRVYNLEDCPEYEALSYVWGPKQNLKRIRLNGRDFTIRPNLFEFLQLYKARQDRGLIWIDQICIDQGSTMEKNHQVAMMDRIYRGARKTFAWLGADPFHGRAFAIMRETDITVDDHEGAEPAQAWSDLAETDKRALFTLFENSYWSRLWVAQEIMLSREAIVWFGTNEMPWRHLSSGFEKLVENNEIPNIDTTGLLDFWYLVDDYDLYPGSSLEMFEKLALFAKRSVCQDLRDKVFGIQSVLPLEVQIPADCSSSVRAVYLAMVTARYHQLPSYGLPAYGIFNFLSSCLTFAQAMGLTRLTYSTFEFARDEFQSHLCTKGYSKQQIACMTWSTQAELIEFLETRVLDKASQQYNSPGSGQSLDSPWPRPDCPRHL